MAVDATTGGATSHARGGQPRASILWLTCTWLCTHSLKDPHHSQPSPRSPHSSSGRACCPAACSSPPPVISQRHSELSHTDARIAIAGTSSCARAYSILYYNILSTLLYSTLLHLHSLTLYILCFFETAVISGVSVLPDASVLSDDSQSSAARLGGEVSLSFSRFCSF